MIEKLESAGLGFYVKATETQQKLGEFTVFVGSSLYSCHSSFFFCSSFSR